MPPAAEIEERFGLQALGYLCVDRLRRFRVELVP